jgi:hypothetical protein
LFIQSSIFCFLKSPLVIIKRYTLVRRRAALSEITSCFHSQQTYERRVYRSNYFHSRSWSSGHNQFFIFFFPHKIYNLILIFPSIFFTPIRLSTRANAPEIPPNNCFARHNEKRHEIYIYPSTKIQHFSQKKTILLLSASLEEKYIYDGSSSTPIHPPHFPECQDRSSSWFMG